MADVDKPAGKPTGASRARPATPLKPRGAARTQAGGVQPDDAPKERAPKSAPRKAGPATPAPATPAAAMPAPATPEAAAIPPPLPPQPPRGPAAKPAAPPQNAEQITRSMADIAERSQRIVGDWLRRQPQDIGSPDPLNIGSAFMEMTARLMANPAGLVQAQIGFWQDYMTLWQNTARRMMGIDATPVIAPPTGDRRFRDSAWKDNEVFDFIKQSYLLSARFVQDVVGKVDNLPPKTAQKVDFYARQFMDAMSPSNFLLTNPEVLRRTAETGGENLIRGLQNLLGDLERGRGSLRIRMTDTDAFRLGENIAVTPGKVVYQNALMQLIQYQPSTDKVLKRPLVIFPPWINKFYILDLRPENSFVRWAVSQGHTVFIVSWVNPDGQLADKDFEDYLQEGVLAALDAIERATGEREINAVGYCLGGTLLASTLAWMAKRHDDRIKTATFFVTMLDFAEAGELGVFIDEEQLLAMEEKMNRRGYLEGSEMAATFNMLRANDLIWSFVVNNYLLGNEPFPFDLLYWNSDSTRMPARMHSFYLRKMYQQNLLCRPGGISLAGEAIDLSKVKVPAYFLATRDDHITPWRSSYKGVHLLGGKNRFVLAASGHIAGVANAPGHGKYNHWVNDELPADPAAWFDGASELAGSWWPDWNRWILRHDRTEVAARTPGAGKLPPLEDAPGAYVLVQAN